MTSSNLCGLEELLFKNIQNQLMLARESGSFAIDSDDITPVWLQHLDEEPDRFIDEQGFIDNSSVKNFKDLSLFVGDVPGRTAGKLGLSRMLGPSHRSSRQILRQGLRVLEHNGYGELLQKYPVPEIGNPRIFRHQTYKFTLMWLKTVYLVGVLQSKLVEKFDDDFLALDIGSSYGYFSSLLKLEYPRSCHVLVDFPEHLILAHYYLGSLFPDAKIAGIGDVSTLDILNNDTIRNYDFVLVPIQSFDILNNDCSFDLVTNFVSLGEMTKKWFDNYLKSKVFTSSKYFFTTNRVESSTTYGNQITILDYPIWDNDKKIHFSVYPLETLGAQRKFFLFNDKTARAPIFEYIGRI